MKLLVTGGCGFIGSHFVRQIASRHLEDTVVNLDALTYAGKLQNLEGLQFDGYHFVEGNICDRDAVTRLFEEWDFDAVVNFAAESHVDNSITGPRIFIETNVNGVMNLLDCARHHWARRPDRGSGARFYQVSTDEVYGSLPENDPAMRFTEETPLDPSSPYSASKAAADLLVQAYHRTYGMPTLISRCSNNYGPNQDTEKLIPLMISKALQDKKLPVYGDGQNIRDWIYVEDHCEAVDLILRRGRPGSLYNIGGEGERHNLDVVRGILTALGKPESLIRFVPDRPGHDRRYAIDCAKITRELEWKPCRTFEEGLKATVEWYQEKAGELSSGRRNG